MQANHIVVHITVPGQDAQYEQPAWSVYFAICYTGATKQTLVSCQCHEAVNVGYGTVHICQADAETRARCTEADDDVGMCTTCVSDQHLHLL